MPADPARVSAVRSIAANQSWAKTANRTERTRQARAASPMSLDYWIAKTKADGIVRPKDRLAAAQNAHQAHMRGLALKAVEARQANTAQRRRPNSPTSPAPSTEEPPCSTPTSGTTGTSLRPDGRGD